jgi:hypothetical protein
MINKCNFCIFKGMTERAADEDKVLLKRHVGTELFPNAVEIFEATTTQVESHKTYLAGEPVAWFAELPDRCTC